MTIIYIKEEHCTSLEQLRSYFEDSPSYGSPLFYDLVDYARSGDISTWLREKGETVLADQVDGIDQGLGDKEYFSRLSALMTGNETKSDTFEKPGFSECLRVEEVRQREVSEGMEVQVLLKVLAPVNETYELAICTSWGLRADTVNPFDEKKDGVLTVSKEFRKRPTKDFKVEKLLADGKELKNNMCTGLGGEELEFEVGSCRFKMIRVEGGSFEMGATSEQGSDANDWEKPVHRVTLSGYYIGMCEVTQELWEAVMGSNPSCFKGKNNPVESVSYNDCQEFIKRLNSLTGKNFRLPTEAEWEYAARGGNQSHHYKYSGSNNIDDVAWYTKNSDSETHRVGTKSPNELGIYDMSGNVWEWCSDRYGSYSSGSQTNPQGPASGTNRVLRGGSWFNFARYCRVSFRNNIAPSYRFNNNGLRLALVP